MFAQVWEKSGEGVIAKLQEHTLAPHHLASVDWRLQINMYAAAIWQRSAACWPNLELHAGVPRSRP